jgi:agmatine deiminase
MLPGDVTILEAPVDEFWMRDHGPTFVVDDERPGVLGAVDWIFNGWGAHDWARWERSAEHARIVAPRSARTHLLDPGRRRRRPTSTARARCC